MLRQEEAKMVSRVTFYLVILQITNESSLFVALHYDSNIFSGVFKRNYHANQRDLVQSVP